MERRYTKKKTWIGRIILLAVAVIIVAAGCYGQGQARKMMGMAGELKADVKTVASGFAAGDPKQCHAALDEMDADAELASAELKKPIWKIASAVPVAGSDVRSAGVLIGVLQDCSESMIRPAAELLEDVSGEGLSATEKAEKLLAFYQSVMPIMSDAAERMSGVEFRVIDRDGKISGYLNTFAAAEQILSRMSDAVVKPVAETMARYPLSSVLSAVNGTDADNANDLYSEAISAWLALADEILPQVEDTLNSVDASAFGQPDKGGRISALLEEIRYCAEFAGKLYDNAMPLLEVMKEYPLNGISTDGKINIAALQSYLSALEKSAPELKALVASYDAEKDAHGLLKKVTDKLRTILELYERSGKYIPALKTFLGDGSDRLYVFVAQNSMEIRASGGFPGSVGTIEIKDGMLSVGDFDSVYHVFTDSVADMVRNTNEEYYIFGGSFVQSWDACYCPDFERAGYIWAYAYESRNKVKTDGVVSMTPCLIQDALTIFGEITLSDGTLLNGENATRVLQHDIYFDYYGAGSHSNNWTADKYFSETAKYTMELVSSGINTQNALELVDVLRKNVEERTLMIYMSDPEEEQIMKDAGCGGVLNYDEQDPELGIFFSIYNASKLGWWTDIDPEISEPVKNADGSLTYNVKASVTNTLTKEEADKASGYILSGTYGTANARVHFFEPAGGKITDFQADDDVIVQTAEYKGLTDTFFSVNIGKGETVTVTFKVTTAPGVDMPLKLSMTPTLQKYR